MPVSLQTYLQRPDGLDTIYFHDVKVVEDITENPIVVPAANNLVVGVDIRQNRRQFTISGMAVVDPALPNSTSKLQVEQLEFAALEWENQTYTNGKTDGTPTYASLFVWGTKNAGGNKSFRVLINRVSVINDPMNDDGGAGNIFQYIVVLTEVGPMSDSGGTT